MPATSSYWDINKAQSDGNGGVLVPFQQYLSPTQILGPRIVRLGFAFRF